jgi:uncharacterized protein
VSLTTSSSKVTAPAIDIEARCRVVGLVSDTHGLVRPELLEALRAHRVESILHAGDVGKPEVLAALAEVAPVAAVRGNVDAGAWAEKLPQQAVVEVGGRGDAGGAGHRVLMIHILEELEVEPRSLGVQAVIYGHSHKPSIETRGGVLYVNPGSAGPRRFSLPITAALLFSGADGLFAELLDLDGLPRSSR